MLDPLSHLLSLPCIPFNDVATNRHEPSRSKGVYAICIHGTGASEAKIYIGSAAQSFYRRLINHRCDLRRGNHHSRVLQSIFNSYGFDCLYVRLVEQVSHESHESKEVFRDRLISREQFWIDAVPSKIRLNGSPTAGSCYGIKQSLESIEKRRISLKATLSIPEVKQRYSEASKRNWEDSIYREKITFESLSMWQSPVYRQLFSAARRAMWQDENYRAKRRESLKSFYKNNPEAIEAKRIAGKKNWEDPELRARMTKINKEINNRPENKELVSKRFTELWSNSEYKEKTSKSILKGHCSISDALILISPKGETYVTDNATAFAEKFNLIQTCVSSVARGDQKKHKGWTGYTASSWSDVPDYALRILVSDHPELPEYQNINSLDHQEQIVQEKELKLKQQAHDSLMMRLKTLGTKSSPSIYLSPSGLKYVSDVPAQFATEMGFTIEGQRHKFSLIIRTDKSYKGWTGCKLNSWLDVPNDAIRVLWGDHPDLPSQISSEKETDTKSLQPIQLALDF